MDLFVFLAFFVVPVLVAINNLQILDAAAKDRQAPVKFAIMDLFGLVFLVSLPLALLSNVTTREPSFEFVVAGIFALLMAMLWWTTVRTESRAGIHDAKWRGIVAMFVIPMSYIGSIATGLVAMEIFRQFAHGRVSTAHVTGLLVLASSLLLSAYLARVAIQAAAQAADAEPNADVPEENGNG